MKRNILIFGVLFFCLSISPAFAQKLNSESGIPVSAPQDEKNKTLAESVAQSPVAVPKDEDTFLMTVQESKARIADQKKSEEKVPLKGKSDDYSEMDDFLSKYDLYVSPVVMTATRVAEPLSQSALPVTVITREQIEKEGDIQFVDAIRRVPGVNVVRAGPMGRTTSVFIRGANANQTLFMIDGVKVSSPTTGAFDPTNLNLDDVERIEIIRGPQSTLYGSEAMGGVINIITRKGMPERVLPHVEGQFEYGSQNSFYEKASVSGAAGPIRYFGSFSRIDTANGTANRRLEHDYYQDTNANGRIDIELPFESELSTSYHFSRGVTPIDDGAFLVDPNAWQKSMDNVVSTALTMNPFSWLTSIVKAGVDANRLVAADPPDGVSLYDFDSLFKLDSHVYTLDWQNTVRPFSSNTVTGGYTFEYDQANNRSFDKVLRNHGFYIQDQQSFFGRLFLTGGARLTEAQSFGHSVNPKVSAAFLLKETRTKFKGSFGTAFRTPSMNELFYPNYGNPNLEPEKSRTFEFGVEQEIPFLNGLFEADLFHSSFENLIQAVPDPTSLFGVSAGNTGKATSDGIELSVSFEPIRGFLTTSGNYTFMQTHDKSVSGAPLLLRPKHSGGVDANFHLLKKLNLNLNARFVGNSITSTFDFTRPARELNPGYGILGVMASYDILDHWQIYCRVEDITATHYEEVLGFKNPSTQVFGGLKTKY